MRDAPTASDAQPLLLYDGECGLCERSVQFTIRHNSKQNVRFAALQSDVGQRALEAAGLPAEYRDSLVLVDDARTHLKSKGAIRLARHLDWPWRALGATKVIPRPVRDWAYDFVAKRRFRWFGRVEACRLPTPQERARFVS